MAIDHALRRRCISATDVGPIFGVDAYRDAFDVWADKHGHAPPFDPNPRMLMGKDVEQGIVQAYSRITGNPVTWKDETVQHKERRWMAASPDGLVLRPEGLERGVDAKLVFWDQRRKWGANPHDVPRSVQLQCWWLMAVLECDFWDVAAWAGEDQPRIYEFERNRELEQVIIARCEEWYQRYVLGDEMPPIGGGKAAAAWLQQTFPQVRADIREATDEEIQLLAEYSAVRCTQEEATERRKELESQIKLAIADREGLEWPGGKFTWKLAKGAHKIQWKNLGTYLLNTRIKTEEEREELRVEYTKIEPPVRKIHFVDEARDISDAA